MKAENEKRVDGKKRVSSSIAKKVALTLLLKPASTTASNKLSPRTFNKDTEYLYISIDSASRRCIRIPHVTRTGTKGTGSSTQSGSIVFLQTWNSIHKTTTDGRWEMLYASTPPAKNLVPCTDYTSLRCVPAAAYHITEQYSKMGNTKSGKHFTKSQWSLARTFSSFWEAALKTERRCFSKVILINIKFYTQDIKVYGLLRNRGQIFEKS